jgi:hypothetical protein
MEVVYFKKAGSRVVRVVAGNWVEYELPGYQEKFFVELSDPANVGPPPLTTISAKAGSTGNLYLSTTYLFANRIAGDLEDPKEPPGQGGSYAGFWRYLNSAARTPAIADAIAGVRAWFESRGGDVISQQGFDALLGAVRSERSLNELMGAAFPHPEDGRGRHLDRVAGSLVLGVLCGAIR